jgi:D-3-phosphoglycerate dehydrogenase
MKILANDGIDAGGKAALEAQGHVVETDFVAQDQLVNYITTHDIQGLLVRSATKVRKDIIDGCPQLRFVGRGGVGIDNIDAAYAKEKGLTVFNTPASSSQSVAELAMSMMFAAARFTYASGQSMPTVGATQFGDLKKQYSKGIELSGKTLAIVGFGRIGKSLAQYALGCGMKVIAVDRSNNDQSMVTCTLGGLSIDVPVAHATLEEALIQADFISLHVPKQPNGAAVIGMEEIKKMKKTAVIVNTSRGGVVNEDDLLVALNDNLIKAACLDVFENEPTPREDLLQHPRVIATPHIGASTGEAQERIGLEIASIVAGLVGA